jgi:hypothetical protein
MRDAARRDPLHGLTVFLRKGRTIPHEAATVDDQVRAMSGMVLSYVDTIRGTGSRGRTSVTGSPTLMRPPRATAASREK